jgi:hypothetical protein
MQASDQPNPAPEIPNNDPPPERDVIPSEVDLPGRRMPSGEPVTDYRQPGD